MQAAASKSGIWYPRAIVIGMAIVFVVNMIMVYAAVHTFSGLETDRAYEKGLAYNQTLAMAEAQDKMGWKVDAELLPQSGEGHRGQLAVTYRDKEGRPLAGLSVTADFVRPTMSGHDLSLPLADQGSGRYAAVVALAFPGQWEMHVTAKRGNLTYQTDQRVFLP